MIKKIIAGLIACATVLSVLSSCNQHEHDYSEKKILTPATCLTAGKMELTCSCGEKIIKSIPKAHVWSESYCGEEQVCTIEGCGQVRTNPDYHSLDYATKTCKNCSRPSIIVNLPEKTNVNIYNSKGEIISVLLVEVESCKVSAETITVTWRAEKTSSGNTTDNALTATVISYKLKDKDGYIVKSGRHEAPDIAVGDKVRGMSFTLNGLELWESYTFEFADVTN